MAKPLKLILALFGTLVLLLASAIVALPFLFDPNDFRGKLSEAVKKETGREFTVGEIRLSVFPWLRVEIDQASLGNAPGFGAQPMLQIQTADVGVKLMPLLRDKKVEASEVKLSGVRALLAVKGDGVSNWADLQPWQQKRAAEAGPDQGSGLADLDIAGIELEDVSLTYADAQAGSDYAVEKLHLKTGRLHGDQAVPVEGGLRLHSGSSQTQADVGFTATVAYDAATGSVQLDQLAVQLTGEKGGVTPADTLAAKLQLKTPQLKYDAAARTVDAGALTVDIENLRSGSEGQTKLLAKGSLAAQVRSDLGKRRHELQGLVMALDLAGSALPGGKAQPLKLQAGVSADLAAGSARIAALKLGVAGLDIAANQLLINQLLSDLPEVSGDLRLAPFSPRSVLTALGIELPKTADPKALATASLSSQLNATPKSLALRALTLKLDDTTLRGDFAVRDLATQALAFSLKGDNLDADRYLAPRPPPSEAPAKPTSPADKAALNATELPVKALDKLNADGTLELARLKVHGVSLSDVRLRLASPGNGLKRQQLSAGLYGGRADIALDVSNPASKPGYALKTTLSGINAGPLLKDFMGKDTVSGKGSVDLDLRSSGLTIGELRKALNGDVAFNLVDGAVKGFNLGKIIRQGEALLTAGQTATLATAKEPQATDFAELRGAGKFVNGVLHSDQLSAKNPLIRLEGAGDIDLVGETINYLAKPTLVSSAKGQGGKDLGDLNGVVIPIRLTGDLYAPKVSIDWKSALSQKATEQLRGKLGAALGLPPEALQQEGGKELLKQKAAEELNKGLLKLFGGKKAAPAPAPAPEPAATPEAPAAEPAPAEAAPKQP